MPTDALLTLGMLKLTSLMMDRQNRSERGGCRVQSEKDSTGNRIGFGSVEFNQWMLVCFGGKQDEELVSGGLCRGDGWRCSDRFQLAGEAGMRGEEF